MLEEAKSSDFVPIISKQSHRAHKIFKVFFIFIVFVSLCLFAKVLYNSFNITPLQEERNTINYRNPTIAWYTESFENHALDWIQIKRETLNCSTGGKIVQCDIVPASQLTENPEGYLFYGTAIQKLPLQRRPDNIWGLVHEESPRNNQELMHEEGLNMFNFSSTFSRYSDVPMPLLWMGSIKSITSKKYFINTSQKNAFLSILSPVLYLQSDCETSTERDEYVKKLKKYIPIDSYGECLKNKKFPMNLKRLQFTPNRNYLKDIESEDILQFIARYKFIVAIENGVCNDYVTEKFWRAILGGVVPIYYGDPMIRDWLPNNKSAVLLEDFPTPELLSQHLYELLGNDKKYEEYLEHKTKGLISNHRIFDELKARPYQTDFEVSLNVLSCLMCERIHDKNSTRVNIVTKKHYDCPLPTSALTLSVNPDNYWLKLMEEGRKTVLEKLSRYIHK